MRDLVHKIENYRSEIEFAEGQKFHYATLPTRSEIDGDPESQHYRSFTSSLTFTLLSRLAVYSRSEP